MPSSLPPILQPTRQAVTKSKASPTRSSPKILLRIFCHIIKNVSPHPKKELRYTEDTNLDIEAKYPRREAENRLRMDFSRLVNPYDTVTPRVEEILETGDYPPEWKIISGEYLESVLRDLVSSAPFLDLDDHQTMKQEADEFAKKRNVHCTHDEFVALLTHEQDTHKQEIKAATEVDVATRAEKIIDFSEYPRCLAHLNPSTLLTALTSIVTLARKPRLSPSRLASAYVTFTRGFSISLAPALITSLFAREQHHHDALHPTYLDRIAPSRALRIKAAILTAFDAADPSNRDLIEDEVFAAVKQSHGVDVPETDVLLHLLESKRIQLLETVSNRELSATQRAATWSSCNRRTGKSARWMDTYTTWKNVRHEEGAVLHASYKHGIAAADTYVDKLERAHELA